MAKSLYIHIPFCTRICGYCDFTKLLYNEEFSSIYIEALKKEIEAKAKGKFETIYVGGGTPTALKDDEFKEILLVLKAHLLPNGEFTVEANPESLSNEKLSIMKEAGVNRLSMGLESASNRLLSLMGRAHSYKDVKDAFKRAREAGINNINIDLIYALPGETLEELDKDIEACLSLKTEHLSTYSLTVNEGTSFFNKGFKEMDDEVQAMMYQRILKAFRGAGYVRYEVSNFGKPGYESRHNLTYWKDEEYVACGLGASGYENGVRYQNTRNLMKYVAGEYLSETEEVAPKDDLTYFFLTNLRLAEGFSLGNFQDRFGFSFEERFEKELMSLIDKGLLIKEDGCIKPTDQGILLLDRILLTLIPDE